MKKMLKDKTNWGKMRALTEKQVIAAAKSDPDNKLLTKAQLKKFKRVNPHKQLQKIKMIEALERREDMVLSDIAKARDVVKAKKVKHTDAWK